MRGTLIGILMIAGTLGAVGQGAANPPLTIDAIVNIKYPSAPQWLPDGHHIVFTWDEAGVYKRYEVDADQPGLPKALGGQPGGRAGGRGRGGAVRSPDGAREARLATAADGSFEIVVTPAAGGAAVDIPIAAQARGLSWSPDGKRLAFSAGGGSVDHNRSFPEIGQKLIFRISGYAPGKLYTVSAAGGTPVEVQTPAGGYGGATWVSGDALVTSTVSADYKTRTLYLLDAAGGAPRAIYTSHDDKFFSMFGRDAAPRVSPDHTWILFGSDASGWDQLYVIAASGRGPAVEVTKGAYASWRAAWSHDSTRIAFDANPTGPGDREIGVVTLNGDPARATVAWLTHGKGTNIAPVWSPDDRRLVYSHTDADASPELYVVSATGGRPVRLTESMPAAIRQHHFVAPQLVHYAAADGKEVPAWLFVPPGLDRTRRHPAIVWIHPDGVNQNYDGWHTDRNEAVYYAFHQYLLQEGYVVIAPDYRGSIGYGRDWREAVYHDVGGEDATDARRAAAYLKTLPYVDPARIGVWGLSYGGFFTLTAVTRQPALFACAVDVAGLVDPAMYYEDPYHSEWMAERMGTPSENPELYARAATSTRMNALERPLLILAGTADVNVPFWESTLLLDAILKDGKGSLVTFMMYPGEFHYFDRGFVLRDAWRRVDEFFTGHLRPAP